MDKSEHKTVRMRFSPRTLEHVENLKKITGITNRTQIVTSSVQLTDILKSRLEHGGRLCIEREDGTMEYITIVGI